MPLQQAPAHAKPTAGALEATPSPARWPVLLALAALLGVVAVHLVTARPYDGRDLEVLLTAGERALRAEPLYRLSDGHWCFKYAPPAALLLAPLSLLPSRAAALLLALGSLVGLFVILRWGASHAHSSGRNEARRPTGARPWSRLTPHLAVVALSLPFTLQLFTYGQIDALLVALVVVSEVTAARRPLLSGVLLALACLFKLPFLLLLAVPLAWREWRRLAGFAAGLALALAVTALLYGPAGLLAELHAWRGLLATTTPRLLCNPQNQSLWAVVCTYAARPEEGVRYLAWVATGGLALAALLGWLALAGSPGRRRFSVVAASLYATAALSPLGWRTNLLAAIPLLHVLVEQARRAAFTIGEVDLGGHGGRRAAGGARHPRAGGAAGLRGLAHPPSPRSGLRRGRPGGPGRRRLRGAGRDHDAGAKLTLVPALERCAVGLPPSSGARTVRLRDPGKSAESDHQPEEPTPELVAALFGLAWFLAIGGYRALSPDRYGWVDGMGDLPQHLQGWLFFRQSPWAFPLGRISELFAPTGTTVGFTDANPLVATVLKLASPLLPARFQYIGLWLAACFALQGWFGARLAGLASDRPAFRVMGGALFALAPPAHPAARPRYAVRPLRPSSNALALPTAAPRFGRGSPRIAGAPSPCAGSWPWCTLIWP